MKTILYRASKSGSPSLRDSSPVTYRNAVPTINSPFGAISSPIKIKDSPVISQIEDNFKFISKEENPRLNPIDIPNVIEKPVDLWNTPKRQLAPLIAPPKPGQDYK